jgi:hypothetical protein
MQEANDHTAPVGAAVTPNRLPAVAGADAEAVRPVLDSAAAVLATHTAREGMCGGCIELWARLAPFPCDQRRWAVAVVERYGAASRPPAARTATW